MTGMGLDEASRLSRVAANEAVLNYAQADKAVGRLVPHSTPLGPSAS